MQIKNTMSYHCTSVRILKFKTMAIPSVSKDGEQLELTQTAGRILNIYIMGNYAAIKMNYRHMKQYRCILRALC